MDKVRMQVTCFIFIAFVAVIYFSIERVKNYAHKLYSCILVSTTINLVFDMITVYTVNHLDQVSGWVNRLCHQIFIASMDLTLFMISLYIVELVKSNLLENKKFHVLWGVPILVSFLVTIFGDLYYMKTDLGNYSYGPVANTCYASCGFYLILSFYIILKNWRQTERRKKYTVLSALIVEGAVSLFQAQNPTALISSIGLTLIVLSIFLTMENPDRVLVELYGQEKDRADAANRAKSDFLASVSHEIRTPINVVLGMDEMILREYHDPQLLDYAQNIERAGQNLLALVNDILDLSKIESGKMEIVPVEYDLSGLINDLTNMISFRTHAKGLTLQVKVNPDLPGVLYGDDIRIRQIISNLLTNAVKYTKEGSVVLEVDEASKQLYPCEDEEVVCLEFRVSDTGIGIKQEDIKDLFKSFKRLDLTKNYAIEGTGLGMSITSQLTEMMDGTLKVESEYGEGSTFTVTIPQYITDREPIGDFHKRYREVMKARGKYRESFVAPDAKILVVDDNEMNLKVVSGLLKQTKVKVCTASRGEECLEAVQSDKYHIIFLDHMMPDMDGIETMKRLRELPGNPCQDTPIIILTANTVNGAKEMYLEEGFTDYLAKPIQALALETMVRKYLPKSFVRKTGAKKNKMKNVPDLDRQTAIDALGSKELFEELFKDYCNELPERVDQLRTFEQAEDLKNYTIAVHGLKSTSRMVGAMAIARLAEQAEECGQQGDIEMVREQTGILIEKMEEFIRREKNSE